MDAETLLAALVGNDGVFEDAGDGGPLRLSPAFRDRVDDWRATLDAADGGERTAALVEAVGEGGAELLGGAVEDSAFLARCCALSESTDLSPAVVVHTGAVLDRFHGDVETDGAPDPFLPVRGDRLSVLLDATPAAVVYVWRHDCPACDSMRESLEEAYAEPPEDVSLFAVYGPEWSGLLHHDYDVVAGPTTLFVLDGSVDSRIHGACAPEVAESEVGILRESATT